MTRVLHPAARPLRGVVAVPGDKSVSHRLALMAPLATATSRVRGWLDAQDTRRSLTAIQELGAKVDFSAGTLSIGPGNFPLPVGSSGPGARGAGVGGGAGARSSGLSGGRPVVNLDCGNSGTTARLLMGLLAGRRVTAVLDGDESLRARPMDRVATPLAALGAKIDWLDKPGRLPLRVTGQLLHGGSVRLPAISAQVKSAMLLAGLSADRPVTISNLGATRDHTERLLRLMRAELTPSPGRDELTIAPSTNLRPYEVEVPGDPSSAAFLMAAALLVPESEVTVGNLLLTPARTGFLRVLERMGARIVEEQASLSVWEPTGAVTVRHGPLRAFTIEPREVPSLIDELPVLAVLAARAEGLSSVSGAAELRVKESDRIAAMTAGLRALGVTMEDRPDGFAIQGPCTLRAPIASCPDDPNAILRTAGDHRIAMAFAVAALITEGETRLDDDACVAISFPDFFDALERLQGKS